MKPGAYSQRLGRRIAGILAATLIAPLSAIALAGDQGLPALETPLWCAGDASFGLTLRDGVISEEGAPLGLPRIPDAFAVAHYKKGKALIVVTRDGRGLYYRQVGARFVQKGEESAGKEKRVVSVRFTRLPSLCYPFLSDLAIERKIAKSPLLQLYPGVARRFAFTEAAKTCAAVPLRNKEETPLGAVYCVDGRVLHLHRGEGWARIMLPEPLGAPFLTGPGDALAQALFLFPKAVIAKTSNAWAFVGAGGGVGKLISIKGTNTGWWEHPFEKEGAYFVNGRTGPGGDLYRFDLTKATLVRVRK